MNITNKLIWIVLFVSIFVLMSFLKDRTDKSKKVVFFGDSITQMGVNPGGYIADMKDMLAQQGVTNYDLVGAGIGGKKKYDFFFKKSPGVVAPTPRIIVIFFCVK